jgi:O-antigen/teichoic acid export membrane protein
MTTNEQKNSRIVKNTFVLYLRSIVVLLITLYTSRVVLATLGVEDYGVYFVVGGVVAVLSSISNSLSGAISRFITFELGRGDTHRLNTVFSTSVQIQVVLALIIVSLILIAGVWFVNERLNIPAERLEAANWVLVCSAVGFGFGLVSATYNALIIAHEHMKAFAYISILSAVLNLGVVFLLSASTFDKLKTYAVLLLAVSLLIQICYWTYCRKLFQESRFRFVWDIALLKSMFGFSGWAFSSHFVGMLNTQGINILTNIYFGVVLNAARGIATQVEGALSQFTQNLTVSVNPQITKSYAANDKEYMFQLICRGSKFAYFSALVFTIPLFIEAETVLMLWLGVVPEYATVFLRLTLLTMLPQVLGGVLFTAAMATGRIRRYSILINVVSIFTFIFTWMLFYLGSPPEVAYLVHLLIRSLLVALRVYLLKSMINFRPLIYFKSVFLRIFPVSILAFAIPSMVLMSPVQESYLRVLLVIAVSVPATLFIVYSIGLTLNERVYVGAKLKQLKSKLL